MGGAVFRILETKVDGKRLGRHVDQDPRSLLYRRALPTGPLKSVAHVRHAPVFDQGELGSCTGNAGTGALASDPFVTTGLTLDETYAVGLYSQATTLDDEPDNYPPTDTGSSGLAICKALRARGLISGYTVATSAAEMAGVLQSVPVIIGVSWYSGFDNPGKSGLLNIRGVVRGGHEIVVNEYDADTQTFTGYNSWGSGWGDQGRFRLTAKTMDLLFRQGADCYGYVPLSQPAPTPTPAPTSQWPSAEVDPWLLQSHRDKVARTAQAALIKLRASLTT